MIRDTVTYPIKSKENFSKTAKVAGFAAQTGAAAVLANKYAVQPSRKAGKEMDAAVKGMYDVGKEVVESIDNLIDGLNTTIIQAEAGERDRVKP